MTDDLIARLKAAHEALPPAPWRVRFEVSTYDGDDMEGHRDSVWVEDARDREVSSDDEDFLNRIVLTRNALPEIIAALEERERMRAVVEEQLARLRAMQRVDPNLNDASAVWTVWNVAVELRAALDALEKKG